MSEEEPADVEGLAEALTDATNAVLHRFLIPVDAEYERAYSATADRLTGILAKRVRRLQDRGLSGLDAAGIVIAAAVAASGELAMLRMEMLEEHRALLVHAGMSAHRHGDLWLAHFESHGYVSRSGASAVPDWESAWDSEEAMLVELARKFGYEADMYNDEESDGQGL
jgi:hypothetical protein